MACLGGSLSALDLRFASLEDEGNFRALLAERRRLHTLVSGISVAAVWLYVQLVLAEVLDLRTWLTLCSALAWLLAAVAMAVPLKSKLCINQEWIWVPLASFCCALMAQPRSEENGPSRLGLVSVAVSATAMLPLRSAVSWLVYVVAVLSFVLGSFDSAVPSPAVVGADSVALLLVATSFYHAGWCREVYARGSAQSEELLEAEAPGKALPEDLQSDEENPEKEPVEVPDHLVLRIAGDLTILPSRAEMQP